MHRVSRGAAIPSPVRGTGVRVPAERAGASFGLRSSVASLTQDPDGRWVVRLADEQVVLAEQVILALPFEQVARLLDGVPAQARVAQLREDLGHFVHAPITPIHLWFDRSVCPYNYAGLLDTRIQWLFNKSRIRGNDEGDPREYLELTISGSGAELGMSREAILASALRELATFFPAMREARVVKSGVLKEARATFSVLPGLDRHRPATDALGDGLYLAGDWTRTGWPATMESAVRSGRLAAEAVATKAGQRQRFMTPDLPASGFMRWIAR